MNHLCLHRRKANNGLAVNIEFLIESTVYSEFTEMNVMKFALPELHLNIESCRSTIEC